METKPRLWEWLCTLSDVILGKSIPFLTLCFPFRNNDNNNNYI